MADEITRISIREYGSDVVKGMPNGQKIKWKNTTFLGVHILEEFEPMGTQKLKTEDIIEELTKVPINIRKYILSIVLSPFSHPYEELFNKRRGRPETAFASADYEKHQITIYAIPAERNVLKTALAEHLTLSHEAGHIIDSAIQPPEMGFFAYTPRWTKAMCEDTKIQRKQLDLPSFLVSVNAEDLKSLREDFADSVMYFADEGRYKEFLKDNFPNRYKILEELLGD